VTQRPRTWHYGLVATWWDEFEREGGEELEYFRALIAEHGAPALDAGCGTGRLLLPLVAAGLDVDGCDVSGDMIARAAERAEAEGLNARLYVQGMHEIDLPRRYRTIFSCGSFGIGGHRAQDLEALRRFHRHLEPGGFLAFDVYLPSGKAWNSWASAPELPRPWPERGDRRTASDGSELELIARMTAFDPLEQVLTRELRVIQWRDGKRVGEQEYELRTCVYLKNELIGMLERAGFEGVRVLGGLSDRPAEPYRDARLMFHARKPQVG
jgi:SAM-dependent methyltransferase